MRLEESKAFEQDLWKVNQRLSQELSSTQSALDAMQKAKKLVDAELKSERAELTVSDQKDII